jgi:hypothetical protein
MYVGQSGLRIHPPASASHVLPRVYVSVSWSLGWPRTHVPLFPAIVRLIQEDGELEASMVYIMRACLLKKKNPRYYCSCLEILVRQRL